MAAFELKGKLDYLCVLARMHSQVEAESQWIRVSAKCCKRKYSFMALKGCVAIQHPSLRKQTKGRTFKTKQIGAHALKTSDLAPQNIIQRV